MAPLPHVLTGDSALAAAMAGLGAGAVADPLIGIHRLRQWALFVAMILGGGAGLAVALVARHPEVAPAVLLGLMAAAVSHASRRVLAVLPAAASPRAQLATAAGSIALASGQPRQAGERYDKALALNPSMANAHAMKGYALIGLKEWSEAKKALSLPILSSVENLAANSVSANL